MSKQGKHIRKILTVTGAILLGLYLIVSVVVIDRLRANELCTGLVIEVRGDAARGFVTSREIARELQGLPERAKGMKLADINTAQIIDRLNKIDKIENVEALRMSSGRIYISVTPLVPVARIFDGSDSYYINREGKRITANARYFSDVPVIEGHFPKSDTTFTPVSLLPLLDYLEEHDDTWGSYVTMLKVDSPTDIILVPAVAGHVVNFGTPDNFDSKFSRLKTVYREIYPVSGWEYYDTISVKWAGQVVATRRVKPVMQSDTIATDDDEGVAVSSMLTAEGVAPGRTKAGQKAREDKPIPASRTQKAKSDTTAKTSAKKETPAKNSKGSSAKPAKSAKGDKDKSTTKSKSKTKKTA